MNTQRIAQKLIELRGNQTQSQVAEQIGVKQSTYAMYESGKRVPSDQRKIIIAKYYGLTVQEIFYDDIEND